MIFVTLGSQDKNFDRLLLEVEKNIELGNIKEEVIVQTNYTCLKNSKMKIIDYLNSSEYNKLLDKASFVITHAGVGTIFDCMKKNKKVIAAARLKKYKEASNDHQKQLLDRFGKCGYILPLYDLNNLSNLLKQINDFKPKKYHSDNSLMVKTIQDFIERNV